MLAAPKTKKARADSWPNPRAFCALARCERLRTAFMPVMHGLVQSLLWNCIRVSEDSYRLYSCAGCASQVRICRRCDRGNRYCADGCAQRQRKQSLDRAGRRYQNTFQGACRHAARQRAWRARHASKVTHHGSQTAATPATVAATLVAALEIPREVLANRSMPPPTAVRLLTRSTPRCSFCQRPLSAFARLGFLRRVG